MVNSLTGLISAGAQGARIASLTARLKANIQALASGNRLTEAATDVAALSVATGLQSQVSSLRTAALNVAQGSSFLQVADGGLQQIGGILDRLQALSVQANSGALSQSAREGLNAEFQQLTQEIDRLAGTTNFNGVKLLDGTLGNNNVFQTNSAPATRASGSLDFTANVAGGQTINLNGVTLTAGANFAVGATTQQTIDNLAAAINSSTNPALSGVTAERVGNSLRLTADSAGSAGNQFFINRGASTAGGAFTVSGGQVGAANIYTLQGGSDVGLGSGSVQANGVVGDSLVTSQNQQGASSTISFTSAANIVAGNTINVDDGNGGFVTFTYTAGPPATSTDIQIGATLEDTLQNTGQTLNNYTGNNDYGIRQLDFSINGNSIEVTSKQPGNPLDVAGAPLNINIATAGGTITNTTLNNGSTGGVDVSNVNNAAFTGKIQGFQAQFNSTSNITASINVGGVTYTANISNTNPAANTSVRFSSQNGGYFDVQLSANNGQVVNDQAGANQFAQRLDSAFQGLNFTQNRQITNFSSGGQLNGASLEIQGSNFNGPLKIDNISVQPTSTGNSSLEISVNGEKFRAFGLGNSIGAGESITLTSLSNANNKITFTNGQNQVSLTTQTAADQFKDNLSKGIGLGSGGVSFQVGSDATQQLQFNIGSVTSQSLFGGKSLNLLSQQNAQAAFATVGDAIKALTSSRADVGAYQQSFNYAASVLESAIQNQEAARATLADTDFASESSLYAQNLVRQQASIATQAQANRLAPSLLKLISG